MLPDQVIPNTVPGAPTVGHRAADRRVWPVADRQTTQNPDGIRGATRFLQGEHGSLLDPTDFPAATVEMQGEMASMVVTAATPCRSPIRRSWCSGTVRSE